MNNELFGVPGEQEFKPLAVKKPAGHIFLDNKVIADTLQCKHCGIHWIPIKGSKKRRGFCMKCFGTTCGKLACDVCIPFEVKLDIHEGKSAGKWWKEVELVKKKRDSFI